MTRLPAEDRSPPDGQPPALDTRSVNVRVGGREVSVVDVVPSSLSRTLCRRPGAGATRPGQPDFEAFLDFVTGLVRAGQLVLVSESVADYGGPEEPPLPWWALVDTIGDCAAVSTTRFGDALSVPPGRLLCGSKEAIRYLCSYSQPLLPHDAVMESTPTRLDFSAFAHLWTTVEADEHFDDALDYAIALTNDDPLIRKVYIFNLGMAMGELHGVAHIIWDDAHEGNFGQDVVQPIAFDVADSRQLYRSPHADQAATGLVPLLSGFSPRDYVAFRAGYLRVRADEGRRVFDLIELRDLTGWKLAVRNDDYELGRRLAQEQLDGDDEMDHRMRTQLYSVICMCCNRLGLHAEALEAIESGLAIAEAGDVPAVTFNLGIALRLVGRLEEARNAFSQVVASEEERPTIGWLAKAARAARAELAGAAEDQG